jgi:ABC-type phosphate/phosphonate transport system permease subunit
MENNNHGGIGFIGWLTLLLIGLKLAGFIEWSWLMVFTPMLVTIVLAFIIIFLAVWVKGRK